MKKTLSLVLVTLLLVTLAASVASALSLPGQPKLPGGGLQIPIKPIDPPQDPIDLPEISIPKVPELIDPKIPVQPPIKIPVIPVTPEEPPKNELPPKLPEPNTPDKNIVPLHIEPPIVKIPPKLPDPSTPKIPDIPKIPIIPLPKVPPKTPVTPGTPKTSVPKAGKFLTSEGPLFIMFRGDLTEGYEMFTPLDLSVDAEYIIPLVSNAMHVVGEVKVTVKKGMVTVHPTAFMGVTLSDDILTFFPDLGSVTTIKPADLKGVDIPFDLPVNVASRLGVDAKVLMYIHCPVSYDAGSASVKPFSLEDPAYLERMYAQIDLMD